MIITIYSLTEERDNISLDDAHSRSCYLFSLVNGLNEKSAILIQGR